MRLLQATILLTGENHLVQWGFGPSHRAPALTALKKEPPYQEEISCELRADKGLVLRVPVTRPGAAGLGAGAAAWAHFGTCTSCGEGALWDPVPQLLSGVLGDPVTSAAVSGPDECTSQGPHSARESSLSTPGPSVSLQQPSAGPARACFSRAAEGGWTLLCYV